MPELDMALPFARITLREEPPGWTGHCVCGWSDAGALGTDVLRNAWSHYFVQPHRGNLYLDVCPRFDDE